MRSNKKVTRLLAAVHASLVFCAPTNASDVDAIMPYLTDDVAAVAYLDLTRIDLQSGVESLIQLGVVSKSHAEQARQGAAALDARIQELRQLGAEQLFILLRISDIWHGGGAWVLPVANDKSPSKLAAQLTPLLPAAPAATQSPSAADVFRRSLPVPHVLTAAEGFVLAATNQHQLDALISTRRDENRASADAMAAVHELSGHSAGLVVIGDADSRRVVREMFPRLPAPFEEIDGRLISDGLRYGGAVVDLPPSVQFQMFFQTKDERTTVTIATGVEQGLNLSKAFVAQQMASSTATMPPQLLRVFETLRPKTVGNRVSITLGDSPHEIAALFDFASRPVRAAQASAQQQIRMNQFKQIAIAFHTYHDRYDSFPAAASRDAQGRPLLSWRVHLLPFLEQQALYDQFHLDEPWDSEHNRQLIGQMPQVFADRDADIRRTVEGQGYTTFVVPTAESTVFDGVEGTPLKEITDGTSQTILLVEVTPQVAVPWTKPADWSVDLNAPFRGVRRDDGRPFVAGFCDGHVRVIDPGSDVDAVNWPRMLTRAGREDLQR